MARTIVGVNDPKAVKKWSGALTYDVSAKSYFNSKFAGPGPDAETPIHILTELSSDAGDTVSYDLVMELRAAPVEGEDTLEGKEEAQRFYTDSVKIDQARTGVNTGGRMTRKRTLHNLRATARRQQSAWWARFQDELLFVYLSGQRGTNPHYLLGANYAGRAGNPLTAPDVKHQLFGGNATLGSNIDSADKFDLTVIDRAVTRAAVQGGGATDVPMLQPCKIDGEERFVVVMHPFQEQDMRANTSAGQWLDIQKAAAGAEGRNSPMFKGSLGMYRGVILHSHRNVTTMKAGAGNAVDCARALFLGCQAGVVAYGSPGTSMRFDWHEETRDNGDKVVISTSGIFGTKKVTHEIDGTQTDFGVFAIDTAAAEA